MKPSSTDGTLPAWRDYSLHLILPFLWWQCRPSRRSVDIRNQNKFPTEMRKLFKMIVCLFDTNSNRTLLQILTSANAILTFRPQLTNSSILTYWRLGIISMLRLSVPSLTSISGQSIKHWLMHGRLVLWFLTASSQSRFASCTNLRVTMNAYQPWMSVEFSNSISWDESFERGRR